jgi:hypothetical protein
MQYDHMVIVFPFITLIVLLIQSPGATVDMADSC